MHAGCPYEEAEIADALNRAFTAARLLTGNERLAENIVTKAIDSWDCHTDPDCSIVEPVIEAAARAAHDRNRESDGSPSGSFPVELQSVMNLPAQMRRSFVLRFLLRRSRHDSACLLGLSVDDFDELTAQALGVLGASRQGEISNCYRSVQPSSVEQTRDTEVKVGWENEHSALSNAG